MLIKVDITLTMSCKNIAKMSLNLFQQMSSSFKTGNIVMLMYIRVTCDVYNQIVFKCTVTESFTEQETEFSRHHMVTCHKIQYVYISLWSFRWNLSITCYGSPPYYKPGGETPHGGLA